MLPEAEESSEEFEDARRLIAEAERVICLGCAYHLPNMRRLNLKTGHGGLRVGSGYELTEHERQMVKGRHGIKVGDTSWMSVRFIRETLDLG